MYALGTHLLVELYNCDAELLKRIDTVKEIMVSAAEQASATIVGVAFHEFNPFGVSGMVVIAESHLSIHTWPEHRYAAVDIFTCGDLIKPQVAAEYIAKKFKCSRPSLVEIKRGIITKRGSSKPSHKIMEKGDLIPNEQQEELPLVC